MIVEKGEGVYIRDTEGNRYLDFQSALWNVNVGYGRVEVIRVLFTSVGSDSNETAMKIAHH